MVAHDRTQRPLAHVASNTGLSAVSLVATISEQAMHIGLWTQGDDLVEIFYDFSAFTLQFFAGAPEYKETHNIKPVENYGVY